MPGVHRIEIPQELGGGWADIKARLSLADKVRLQMPGISVGASFDGSGELTANVETFDFIENQLAPLWVALVSWSLLDDDGAPLSASREGVLSDALPADVGEYLLEQVKEYYASTARSKSGVAAAEPGA